MRRLLLLLLCITGLSAQTPPMVKLTVRVVDSSIGTGVANAYIDLYGVGGSDAPDHVPDTDFAGLSGVMVEQNTSFVVHASAPGYAERLSAVTVARTDPLSVTVSLDRAATLFGHVIDADSGKPLADVPVWVLQVTYVRGTSLLKAAGTPMQTDAKGRFEAQNLLSGDYIVETNFSWESPAGKLPSDQRYARQAWPGGRDIVDATPLFIPPGAAFDFGTISLEKRTLATVKFRIVGDCAGHSYDVRLVQFYSKGGLDRALAKSVECDQPGSFAQVSPGGYSLIASQTDGQDTASGRIADSWLEITNSDITVDLALRPVPMAAIHGHIVSEVRDGDANNTAVQGVSISFVSAEPFRGLAAGTALAANNARADAAGTFEQQVYIPPDGKVAVRLTGLRRNLFVASLRLNGTRVESDEFVLNESAVAQDLEVICSDKFGVVSGEFAGKESDLVDILLVPWPNGGVNYPSKVTEIHADPEGKFAFSPVRPGHYRVLAVRSADRQKFEVPYRLMRVLAHGVDVVVTAGAANNVRIEKLEP